MSSPYRPIQILNLLAGPLLGILVWLLGPFESDSPEIARTAGVAIWMAVWWLARPVALGATALLPFLLFPILGVLPAKELAPAYFHPIIFLFLGGFLIAIAMERWGLHRRLGLFFLNVFGAGPRGLLAGVMLATAVLSMWLSNTATALMFVPVVLATLASVEGRLSGVQSRRLANALLLGVAYAASIGGVATLIGTPPNLALAAIYADLHPDAEPLTFAGWLWTGIPVAATLLLITWLYLGQIYLRKIPGGRVLPADYMSGAWARLGRMSPAEKWVGFLFGIFALLLVTRQGLKVGDAVNIPGWGALLPEPKHLHDGVVAIGIALLMFIIPARGRDAWNQAEGGGDREPDSNKDYDSPRALLDRNAFARLPWEIVLLFGGGFALSKGIAGSGLALWMGDQVAVLGDLPGWLVILVVALAISFLTELTSNTATAQILLPILAAVAPTLGLEPLQLMIPGALACSFAFMLPVATPPNAIVFGTERIDPAEMARTGFALNLAGVAVITLAALIGS